MRLAIVRYILCRVEERNGISVVSNARYAGQTEDKQEVRKA